MCRYPILVDAKVALTNVPHWDSGQILSVSPQGGLKCVNAQNPGGCLDYKVRFLCCPNSK